MKRPNITPGPWDMTEEEFEEYWMPDTHYNAGPAACMTRKEDARAIAAVPALLEALETLAGCQNPVATYLYDEESVEGWKWVHDDGREWSAIGEHDENPPLFPPLQEAMELAGYTF